MLTNINQFGSESIIENLQIAMKEQLSDDDSDEEHKITWMSLARDIKAFVPRKAKSVATIQQVIEQEDDESHGHCSCSDDEEQFSALQKYNS